MSKQTRQATLYNCKTDSVVEVNVQVEGSNYVGTETGIIETPQGDMHVNRPRGCSNWHVSSGYVSKDGKSHNWNGQL